MTTARTDTDPTTLARVLASRPLMARLEGACARAHELAPDALAEMARAEIAECADTALRSLEAAARGERPAASAPRWLAYVTARAGADLRDATGQVERGHAHLALYACARVTGEAAAYVDGVDADDRAWTECHAQEGYIDCVTRIVTIATRDAMIRRAGRDRAALDRALRVIALRALREHAPAACVKHAAGRAGACDDRAAARLRDAADRLRALPADVMLTTAAAAAESAAIRVGDYVPRDYIHTAARCALAADDCALWGDDSAAGYAIDACDAALEVAAAATPWGDDHDVGRDAEMQRQIAGIGSALEVRS